MCTASHSGASTRGRVERAADDRRAAGRRPAELPLPLGLLARGRQAGLPGGSDGWRGCRLRTATQYGLTSRGCAEHRAAGRSRRPMTNRPSIRQHVIEMQVVGAPARHAPPVVPLPNRQLHIRRDQAVVLEILRGVAKVGIGVVHELQLELEDLPRAACLSPCVDEAEHAVESPDVRLDLLVDMDELWLITAISMPASRLCEFPIRVECALRRELGWSTDLGPGRRPCGVRRDLRRSALGRHPRCGRHMAPPCGRSSG